MESELAELLSNLSLEQVLALVEEDFEAVNLLIQKDLYSKVPLVVEIAEYIVGSGGKRLRPLVVLLTARSCNYRGKDHISLATLVEYLHTATLLHDDVVDASSRRRGRATANVLWGNAPSILVGDFLYSRAFQLMVKIRSMSLMEVISEATNQIAEGEVLQLQHIGNISLSEAQYMEIIRCKTAKLFEAAAHTAANLAHADVTEARALSRYGLHLGMAFQLIDDWLDFAGTYKSMGKNIGDDMAEGKATLPLIHTMQHGTPEAAQVVKRALTERDANQLPDVIQAVKDSNSLDYCRRLAEAHTLHCIESIKTLPSNKYREGLEALASIAVCRMH